MPDDGKIFSEKEAGEVMRRAAQLQEAEEDVPYSPGITTKQLADMAKEIGVDSKYLERAIKEKEATGKRGLLNLTVEYERVVEGELDPDKFDIVLENAQPIGGRRQVPNQVGRTLNAQVWTGISGAQVKVTSRGGRTRINVKSSPVMAYLMGLHPAVISGVVLLPILANNGYVALGLGVFAGLLTAGGMAFRWLLRKGHEAAGKLADKLENVISDETRDLRKNLGEAPPQANEMQETQPQRTGSA